MESQRPIASPTFASLNLSLLSLSPGGDMTIGRHAVLPNKNNRRSSSCPPGFVSAIERATEEEEYRKARARKGVDIEGYTIKGVSIGGHKTSVIVRGLNAVFDIGSCLPSAVNQDNLFITHADIDHIGGLPTYVATRGLYRLKPPTIFVPPCIKSAVGKLFEVHRSMIGHELKHKLVALGVGMPYAIGNNLIVRPFKTHHLIQSQGYVIYSVRKKLKKEYIEMKSQIIELKASGIEITDTQWHPEVAFTGDTTSDFLFDPQNADALKAKVLITEATYLDEGCDVALAQERGHMHLFEIMENAHLFQNKSILLTHFSARYKMKDIRRAVSKLQRRLSSTKVVALTEGFKS